MPARIAVFTSNALSNIASTTLRNIDCMLRDVPGAERVLPPAKRGQ